MRIANQLIKVNDERCVGDLHTNWAVSITKEITSNIPIRVLYPIKMYFTLKKYSVPQYKVELLFGKIVVMTTLAHQCVKFVATIFVLYFV